jgi:hypothetical protein
MKAIAKTSAIASSGCMINSRHWRVVVAGFRPLKEPGTGGRAGAAGSEWNPQIRPRQRLRHQPGNGVPVLATSQAGVKPYPADPAADATATTPAGRSRGYRRLGITARRPEKTRIEDLQFTRSLRTSMNPRVSLALPDEERRRLEKLEHEPAASDPHLNRALQSE